MRLDVEPELDPSAYPFRHRIRVRFAETDAMGIVHHSRYLPYLEEARVAYLRDLGHPYTALREEGIDYAVLECFVQYRRPLRFDDVVDVHLVLASCTRASFQMAYLLTVPGAGGLGAGGLGAGGPGAGGGDDVCATAVTVHGCVNPQGRPVRMPAWLASLAPPGRRDRSA